MKMEMTKDHPRASVSLWIVSYLVLLWSIVVHLVDRVLLLLTPTPRSARWEVGTTQEQLTGLVGRGPPN